MSAPEQEPVAFVHGDDLDNLLDDRLAFIQRTKSGHRKTALYTTPPQRHPLTDTQLNVIASKWHLNLLNDRDKADVFAAFRAIEAAHGIGGAG